MLIFLLLALVLPFYCMLPRRRVLAPTLWLSIWGVGVAGFVSIDDPAAADWVLVSLVSFLVLALLLPERWLGMAQIGAFLHRKSLLRGLLLSLTALLILTLVPECVVCALATHGMIRIEEPLKVVMTARKEDWRVAAIFEAKRLQDPVTFWRPAPEPPYNAQGFKGPVMQVPKPPGLLRVMCYGDSNTDGPTDGGWAVRLGKVLQERMPGRKVEVVNAGVSGYSSYQGLRKFEGEADRYQPDLILVSFGWNDAPEAIGQVDKDFAPAPPLVAAIQRALFGTRSYCYLMQVLREWKASSGPPAVVGPRVSVPDYAENVRGFARLAAQRGIGIVLLTRPYKDPVQQNPGWRRTVPDYNAALRKLAEADRLPLIDVQQAADGHPELFVDECHFSAGGHDVAAVYLALQLAPMLAR